MTEQHLALHVLQALATAQREGRAASLQTLVDELQVRRGDVRSVVGSLHERGLVDALRMKLTLRGFAIGAALAGAKLKPLRAKQASSIAA